MPAGTVEVFLIGAVGIKDTEIFGKADPYAILICGKQKLRSNTASNQGSKPIWNQKFSFYIDDKANDLQIKVYNHNILTEDDELGSTLIPLAKVFADGKLPTTSYNVVRPKGRVQGEIKLSITFTPKNKSAHQTAQDIPGPYNAKVYGSPYAAIPPTPTVKHDPLKGPNGYFRNNPETSSSSPGRLSPSVSSNFKPGASIPYPPFEGSTYPPSKHSSVHSVNDPYQRTGSGLSYEHSDSVSSSSDGSSHGRLYPVAPSTTDYTGGIYVQSPYGQGYPRPSPPAGISSSSHHLGASSMPSASRPYSPPAHSTLYPSGPSPNVSHGSTNQFQFDDLAGNFASCKISGSEFEPGSHGSYPGYNNTQSFSENLPPAGYPPIESFSGRYDHTSNGRHPDAYPPPVYPTAGFPTQYDSGYGGYPGGYGGYPGSGSGSGSYSGYGYEAVTPSFYPQSLGVPQQPYERPNSGTSPSSNAYPPVPYYNTPPPYYVPAGYPK